MSDLLYLYIHTLNVHGYQIINIISLLVFGVDHDSMYREPRIARYHMDEKTRTDRHQSMNENDIDRHR